MNLADLKVLIIHFIDEKEKILILKSKFFANQNYIDLWSISLVLLLLKQFLHFLRNKNLIWNNKKTLIVTNTCRKFINGEWTGTDY